MLGLFDYWRKTTDMESEFIIRKPLGKLANELKRRGLRYHALYYTNWAQRNSAEDPMDIYWYAKQNTKAVAKIEKIIQEMKPDVVMTNTLVAPWAAIAAHNQKVPHIWFIREFGDLDHGFEFRVGRQQTYKIMGQLSELVVTNSKALNEFAAKYIGKNKTTTLYPFLDFNEVDKLARVKIKQPFKEPDSLKVVITGRIAPSKGQAVVATAVGELNKEGINCELCIIGGYSDKRDDDSLQTAINKYHIADKVHLVGYQYNPLPYVAPADIGIMASGKEAFGRVTLEYMALGKAVVGANSGGTPELIETNVDGFLYDPNNPSELIEALRVYANDRRLIDKHGQAAKRKAILLMEGEYTPDKLYEKIVGILSSSKNFKPTTSGTGAWNQYPIMINPASKKPRVKYSKRWLRGATKRFLKSLYVHLK